MFINKHAQAKIIHPGAFLPAAEHYDLIDFYSINLSGQSVSNRYGIDKLQPCD